MLVISGPGDESVVRGGAVKGPGFVATSPASRIQRSKWMLLLLTLNCRP